MIYTYRCYCINTGWTADGAFSQRCRRYDLKPHSLAVRPLVLTHEGHQIATRASRQFLVARIQHCYNRLRRLETDLYFQKCQLEHVVHSQHFASIKQHKEQVQVKVKTSCEERQKKKFDALVARWSLGQRSEHHHVVNLSLKELTSAQLQALSRGLNFAPRPQFIPKAHIVANVEVAITRSGACEEQDTKAHIRVIGALSHAKPPPKNTLPEERQAVKQLASDKHIVVLPVDKGRATVVMAREDYNTKIKALLDDRNTYKPVAKDPTSALERKMNSTLLDLRRKGRLSEEAYHHLRSSAGSVSRLYGLPKVHKPDTPLRPIVSFISSPTYRLSKFLASLLKPVVGQSVHHVKNSQQFAEFITSQRPSTEVLVSFDVVSLFA